MIKARTHTPPLLLLLVALLLLPSAGCRTQKEQEAYDNAYKAAYKAGHEEGRREGERRGNEEGRERGGRAAREAAEKGVAWQLYASLALGALASGLLVGLCAQYGLLAACRRTERLPQFSTVAFVPAMKDSLAYSIFEKRRRLMVEIEEELREMCARRNLQAAQLQEVHDAVARRLQAISSIEELSRSRILELAAAEFDRIITNSARRSGRVSDDPPAAGPGQQIAYACPHCRQIVRYTEKLAGRAVNCPNPECGRRIELPPLFSDADGAPLVLDITGD